LWALFFSFIIPNPFSGNAILTVNLSKSGKIGIDIFNPSGICDKSQYLMLQQPGQQEVNLDLRGNPPGIYFLQINIADRIITRKMVKY
jgi:hypothetical protein